MNNGHKIYRTGFGDQAFEIDCNNDDAYDITEFLFRDFPGSKNAQSIKQYDIISSGPVSMLSLWDGDKRLYLGESRYQLAYTLINEVIFHSINTNDSHHALHAGCVCNDSRCILLPGQSGNGKSTLTSWLVMNGFQYLTDELVLLDSEARALPMTRPISLKVGPGHDSWLLADECEEIIASETGSMIPHRLFNADFTPQQPKVTDIIFPQFNSDAEPELKQISPAKSSLYLLKSHVNARNLAGHGVSEMASIVKQCRSYTLSYASFDDLLHIFNEESAFFT
ncbi:MAG: hypothetical protein ACI8ZB_000287 [Desulforhopalus sp.]|jgi:hypothetical protein